MAFYRNIRATLGWLALALCAPVTALPRTSSATNGAEIFGAGGLRNRPVAVQGASSTPRPVVVADTAPTVDTAPKAPRPVWRESEVVLSVDSSFLAMPYAMQALHGALDAWTSRSDALPKVTLKFDSEPSATRDSSDELEDHRLFFAPFGDVRAKGALAVTLVTSDESTDTIVDADILVNGGHRFTDVTTMSNGDLANQFFDLQDVLTHEFGHWFGLDEDLSDAESTMFAYVFPGEIRKRDLTDGDIAQVEWAYLNANDTHSNGVGCAVSRSRSRPAQPWLLALAFWGLSRRGRRRGFGRH